MFSESRLRTSTSAVVVLFTAAVPPAAVISTRIDAVRSNVPAAIAAFMAYEFVVAVLAFGAAVGAQLRGVYASRTAEALDSWLQRRFSLANRKVLRYMNASTRFLELHGVTTRGKHTLELADAYVHLGVDSETIQTLLSDPLFYGRKSRSDPRSLWFWMREARPHNDVVVIVGPPGSGKTTLLRHAAFVLAQGGFMRRRYRAPHSTPVILNLRDHRDRFIQGDPPSLANLVESHLGDLNISTPSGWVERQLQRGRLTVMLDGLDEVADSRGRQVAVAWTETQNTRYTSCLIIVTSRPFGYRENPLNAAIVLQVRPFSTGQMEAFIGRWYVATTNREFGGRNPSARLQAEQSASSLWAVLESNQHLTALAQNPLLLTMICNVHQYRGALPGNRWELYKEICEVFLGKRHQARGIDLDLTAAQRQSVLQVLALHMTSTHVRDIGTIEAVETIRERLGRVSPTADPLEFLRSTEELSGLLLEREAGQFTFAHLSFQDFLTASQLRDSADSTLLLESVVDPWWHETARLYAAMTDATDLLDSCLSHRESMEALVLAVECLNESREIAPQIRAEVEALLNPPEATANKSDRKVAVLLEALVDRESDIRVGEHAILRAKPVSTAAYAAFLDDSWDRRSYVPDHWLVDSPSAGTSPKPVTGLRPEDALEFSRWISQASHDDWTYRLPTLEEVGQIPLSFWDRAWKGSRVEAIWCSSGDQARAFVPRHEPRSKATLQYLEDDLSALLDGHDRLPHASGEYEVQALMSDAIANCRFLNIAALQTEIQDIAELVYSVSFSSKMTDPNRRRSLSRYGNLMQDLVNACAITLTRAAPISDRLGSLKAERADARRMCLSLILMSQILSLDDDVQSDEATPWNQSSWRRALSLPVDRQSHMQDRDGIADVRQRMANCYVQFAMLEHRIDGASTAWEGVQIVKTATFSDPDEFDQFDYSNGLHHRPYVEHLASRGRSLAAKSVLDRIAAFSALLFVAPALLVVLVAALVRSRESVVRLVPMVGRHGRVFRAVTFTNPSQSRLPLLFNVLTGSLSLVGPEPIEAVPGAGERELLPVKPGLSGLGVLSQEIDSRGWRGTIDPTLHYAANWSLRFDLAIVGSLIERRMTGRRMARGRDGPRT